MADDNVSPESHAALTGNNNKLELIREFVNRYEQKYWPLSAHTSRDPRLDTIFNMLKHSALGYYEESGAGPVSFTKGVAVVFSTEPYVGDAGTCDDIETGLNADAAILAENKINVRCYILTDERSLVVSPPIEDLVKELSFWATLGYSPGAPVPLISSLPLFTYEADKGQISQAPILGDIVKISSDSSNFLRGKIEGITKANIAYLMTLDPTAARRDFDNAMAETIGDTAPTCAPTGAPTYLPSQMRISFEGSEHIWEEEGFRRWIYDDVPGSNTDYEKWMKDFKHPLTQWRWSDYYVPKAYSADADPESWRTDYRAPTGFGSPKSVPSIGVGHAIKIDAPGAQEGSLALPLGENERDFFMNNFKKFFGSDSFERKQRQKRARGNYASEKARFKDYRPDLGDDPPMTIALGKTLLKADIEAHCRYFKANITKPITQYQFDALASYAFNAGPLGIGKKSMPNIVNQINRGNCDKAAELFITSESTALGGDTREGALDPYTPYADLTKPQRTFRGRLNRRKREASLFATGHRKPKGGTPTFLINALSERREADTEVFLENRGAKREYVGKTVWFQDTDAYATWQNDNPLVTVTVTNGEAKFEDIPPPEAPTEEGNTQETIGSTTAT